MKETPRILVYPRVALWSAYFLCAEFVLLYNDIYYIYILSPDTMLSQRCAVTCCISNSVHVWFYRCCYKSCLVSEKSASGLYTGHWRVPYVDNEHGVHALWFSVNNLYRKMISHVSWTVLRTKYIVLNSDIYQLFASMPPVTMPLLGLSTWRYAVQSLISGAHEALIGMIYNGLLMILSTWCIGGCNLYIDKHAQLRHKKGQR